MVSRIPPDLSDFGPRQPSLVQSGLIWGKFGRTVGRPTRMNRSKKAHKSSSEPFSAPSQLRSGSRPVKSHLASTSCAYFAPLAVRYGSIPSACFEHLAQCRGRVDSVGFPATTRALVRRVRSRRPDIGATVEKAQLDRPRRQSPDVCCCHLCRAIGPQRPSIMGRQLLWKKEHMEAS